MASSATSSSSAPSSSHAPAPPLSTLSSASASGPFSFSHCFFSDPYLNQHSSLPLFLCRSLRIALKVWLFIHSLSEDSSGQPSALRSVLQRCERAACDARWLAPVVLPLPRAWESFHHHDTGLSPHGSYADFHAEHDHAASPSQRNENDSESGASCATDSVEPEGRSNSAATATPQQQLADSELFAGQDSNSFSDTRSKESCESSNASSENSSEQHRQRDAIGEPSTSDRGAKQPESPERLRQSPPKQRWSSEACAGAFCKTRSVIDELCNLGLELRDIVGRDARQSELRRRLAILSETFGNGSPVLFPLGNGPARMLRIPPDEAILLNSRDKAPYFICVEVLEQLGPEGVGFAHGEVEEVHEREEADSDNKASGLNSRLSRIQVSGMSTDDDRLIVSPSEGGHTRVSSSAALEKLAEESGRTSEPVEPRDDQDVTSPSPARTKRDKRRSSSKHDLHENGRNGTSKHASGSVSNETFEEKRERVREESPYGSLLGWGLKPVIVKTGDDCRQELLAAQVTSTFQTIFHEAGLPLWLRPYEVFVSGARAALMEAVPDAPSLHSVKSRSPQTNLLEHFKRCFGPRESRGFKDAQRAFIESLAAYSLVSYILQLKDRHNGNILLDNSGHVINIDFSFMLSTTPGGINFESAPFKLTREFLEVMDSDADGLPSESFNYFKVLVIQGFLAARKHAERIVQLVEILQPANCPCFKSGTRTISQLKRRFRLDLTEEQCVEHVLSLVSDSLDAWSTRQYDNYQALVVGIQQ
jgi:hypothetical protein